MRFAYLVPVLPLIVLACTDAAGPSPSSAKTMTLSFSTRSAGAPTAGASRVALTSASGVSTADSANTLTISRVQLVVEKLELEKAGTIGCSEGESSDDDSHTSSDDGCEEFETAPLLIDLPLTIGATAGASVSVPQGNYDKLELKVRSLLAGRDDATAFLAAHPDFAGISVRVDGTFNGAPFVYTSPIEAELELEFSPPVVIDQNGSNITVSVDVSSWFRSSTGEVIDPATAVAGGINSALVSSNIRASFHAFEDEDRDGSDDHGEHSAGDDH
jgi:hypothetical protein